MSETQKQRSLAARLGLRTRQLREAEARVRELQSKLWRAKKEKERHTIASWNGFDRMLIGHVQAATRMGYAVEITATGETLTLQAVRREDV